MVARWRAAAGRAGLWRWPDGDHDAGRGRPQGLDVGTVAGGGAEQVGEEHLGGGADRGQLLGGGLPGWRAGFRGDRAAQAGVGHELGHRLVGAVGLVGVVDVLELGADLVVVGEQLEQAVQDALVEDAPELGGTRSVQMFCRAIRAATCSSSSARFPSGRALRMARS
jgi:hypothetical protein